MHKHLKHAAGAVLEGSLVAALGVGLIAGSALAGRPVVGGTTTSFRVDNGSFATTTVAHRGSSGATWVHAKCYQGGTMVFEQWRSYLADGTTTLSLGPTPMWSAGAASCTAEEGYYARMTRWRPLGTATFEVAA